MSATLLQPESVCTHVTGETFVHSGPGYVLVERPSGSTLYLTGLKVAEAWPANLTRSLNRARLGVDQVATVAAVRALNWPGPVALRLSGGPVRALRASRMPEVGWDGVSLVEATRRAEIHTRTVTASTYRPRHRARR